MRTTELLQTVSIPPGESGDWRVESFAVSDDDARFGQMRAAINGCRRYVPAGTYTSLRRGPQLVMSDTPDERRDHWEPVHKAAGSILISGLGLGMVTSAILRKPDVTDVTVIEKSADVVALVAPHIADDRLSVINEDIFSWSPPKGKRWSVVWHDIWDDLCTDNLEEMTKLKRKFCRRCDWQGCWGESELRYRRRQERRMGW